jgi:hypothetical protein
VRPAILRFRRVVRRRAAVALLAATATIGATSLAPTGCAHGPRADPLAADRARLVALEGTPAPADFLPEARLALAPALVAREVQRTLDIAARTTEALRIELPILGALSLRPRATVTSLVAEDEAGCAGCVALRVGLEGTLAPVLGDGLLPAVAWRADARGVFSLESAREEEGGDFRVRAIAKPGAPEMGWRAEVVVEGASEGSARAVSDIASRFLQRLIESEARPELLLATIPADAPVRVRALRTRASGGGIVVDLAFAALDAGALGGDEPVPADGFVLAVPDRTLLAIARAAALRTPVADDWVADPTAIGVEHGKFALDLRIWNVARAPRARDVRVEGRVRLEGDKLELAPERATETKGADGFDPFDFIVRAEILRRTSEALRLVVPTAHAGDLGGRTVVVRLVGVRDEGDVLRLDGTVAERGAAGMTATESAL